MPGAGRAASGSARPLEAGDAQDRDVVARVEGDRRARRARPGAAGWTVRVAPGRRRRARWSPRAPSRGDPARALDAQAAGGAEHPHDAARRGARPRGSRAIAARGAGTSAGGPSIRGNGSKRASALRIGPDGGRSVVERAQDRRALDVVAQRRAPGRLQRDRAGEPHQPERRRRPSAPRRPRRRRRRAPGSAQPPAQPEPSPSSTDAEEQPAEQRAERGRTAARRASASPAESTAARRAPRGTRRPRSRPATSAPTTKPCAQPANGEQERERDDDPVEPGHRGPRRLPSARLGHAGAVSRGARTSERPPSRTGAQDPPRRPPARRRRARVAAPASPCSPCARVAFVVGLVVGARHKPAGRRPPSASRRPGSAATTPRCTRADRRRRDRVPPRALHRAPTARPRDTATRGEASTPASRARTASASASRSDRARACSGTVAATSSLPVDRRRRSTGAPDLVFPGLRRGEQLRARRPCRRARRSWRATARRWPRAPDRASPLGRWRRRGRRPLGPIPPERARASSRALGYPPTRAVGLTGLERDLRRARWPARPGGELRAGAPRARARAGRARRAPVRTTIDPARPAARRSTALAGRLGGVAALRPAHRRGARARRASRSRRPAAARARRSRSSRDRRARGGHRQARDDASRSRPQADARGRRARERQRRVVRRHARRVLRRVVQLGLRAAGRQARRQAARRDRRALRLQPRRPASPARRRARSRAADEIGDDLAVGSTAIGQGKVLATRCRWRSSRRRSACAAAARA